MSNPQAPSSDLDSSFKLFGDLIKGINKNPARPGINQRKPEDSELSPTPPQEPTLHLPQWVQVPDVQLHLQDNTVLLQRILTLQKARSETYSLYHKAFAELVEAAEEAADSQLAQISALGKPDNRSPLSPQNHHHNHSCAEQGGLVIDPKLVKPAFDVFAKTSERIAQHFQRVSQGIIQVEDVLKQRAQDIDVEQSTRKEAKEFAALIRSLQRLEQKKLETTVRQQAITTRHRVIQNDPFSEEYSKLSLGIRQAMGKIILDINEILSDIRVEVYSSE